MLLMIPNFGRRGNIDGERQGRVGLRAGAGRVDVQGDRQGQVPTRHALRFALLLGAQEQKRLGRSAMLRAFLVRTVSRCGR
jgi:hypothetical protein